MADQGERLKGGGEYKVKPLDNQMAKPSLDDLGISAFQSHRWQKMAEQGERRTEDDGKSKVLDNQIPKTLSDLGISAFLVKRRFNRGLYSEWKYIGDTEKLCYT